VPRGASSPWPRTGPLAGAVLGAALGVSLFLLAVLFHDRLLSPARPPAPPPDFRVAGDPRSGVTVLATAGAAGVRALLAPLREDGAPAGAEEHVLDAALFPSGDPHRWMRLLVTVPAGGAPFTLPLAAGSVTVTAGDREFAGEDLAAAFRRRTAALSPHRRVDFVLHHVPDSEVSVPPGGSVRVLVAFPGGARGVALLAARIPGAPPLTAREVTVESLRSVLFRGNLDALVDADRTEARAATPATGGVR
jgi:hypothetical protein